MMQLILKALPLLFGINLNGTNEKREKSCESEFYYTFPYCYTYFDIHSLHCASTKVFIASNIKDVYSCIMNGKDDGKKKVFTKKKLSFIIDQFMKVYLGVC